MAKTKVPKLCVMFDTNILYTQVASDLVRHSVRDLIKENSEHIDLDIEWHIPEIVVGERRFQMLTKANELLPSMRKMERLLGHGFGIGDDTLEMHVNQAINTSIKESGFIVEGIDVSNVDWNEVINRSVTRRPPFEDNEKEKGFRDSVIANSFMQLHKSSPTTPAICKLALVAEDKRLREYVQELTVSTKNVRILSNLDELESLINTLVSEVPEDFAEELTKKASKLFFETKNEKTIYYKQGIADRIREQYAKELNDSPIKNLLKNKTGKTWWISEPVFIRKDKSRIYWTSSVKPEFELYHMEKLEEDKVVNPFAQTESPAKIGLIGTFLGTGKKVVILNGKDIFEVHWNTNLSASKNLTAPKLEKITYEGNDLPE